MFTSKSISKYISLRSTEGDVPIEMCVVPQPINGYSLPQGTSSYENGVIFEFTCTEGFALQGHAINICLNGELAIEIPTCHSKIIAQITQIITMIA